MSNESVSISIPRICSELDEVPRHRVPVHPQTGWRTHTDQGAVVIAHAEIAEVLRRFGQALDQAATELQPVQTPLRFSICNEP